MNNPASLSSRLNAVAASSLPQAIQFAGMPSANASFGNMFGNLPQQNQFAWLGGGYPSVSQPVVFNPKMAMLSARIQLALMTKLLEKWL